MPARKVSDSVSSRVSNIVTKPKRIKFSAFTLAELIVVVTILAMLASIGFIALSGYLSDARESVSKANVRSVYTAISAESAIASVSPRYFVVHDPAYALSGTAVIAF
ncbi:MAG: prepilin-type N-terminal cleavage/methylation domain-containing protein [Patescibacteria group bacterium]